MQTTVLYDISCFVGHTKRMDMDMGASSSQLYIFTNKYYFIYSHPCIQYILGSY